jgi:hypothetical protein
MKLSVAQWLYSVQCLGRDYIKYELIVKVVIIAY